MGRSIMNCNFQISFLYATLNPHQKSRTNPPKVISPLSPWGLPTASTRCNSWTENRGNGNLSPSRSGEDVQVQVRKCCPPKSKHQSENTIYGWYMVYLCSIYGLYMYNLWIIYIYIYILSGWWLTYPSEKNWSIGMIIPNIWKHRDMFQTTNKLSINKHSTDDSINGAPHRAIGAINTHHGHLAVGEFAVHPSAPASRSHLPSNQHKYTEKNHTIWRGKSTPKWPWLL